MGKCEFNLPSWGFSRIKEFIGSYDAWDIAGLLLQIPLQTLFLLGTVFLTLQVTWMRLRTKAPAKVAASSSSNIKSSPQQKDFTRKELAAYSGITERDQIYVAVNGNVFDVSAARNFYGPGCAYSVLAGRDASRAFATFSLEEMTTTKDSEELDDLTDLNPLQLDSLFEWEMQFNEKYTCVGRLVKYHDPKRLQSLCMSRIREIMDNAEHRLETINELPLPTVIKQRLITFGKTQA